MAQPQIFQGTWEQFVVRAEEFRRYKNLLLIVPAEEVTVNTLSPTHRNAEQPQTIDVQETARIEAIRAGMGKLAHFGPAIEELHRERQADKRKEEQQAKDLQP